MNRTIVKVPTINNIIGKYIAQRYDYLHWFSTILFFPIFFKHINYLRANSLRDILNRDIASSQRTDNECRSHFGRLISCKARDTRVTTQSRLNYIDAIWRVYVSAEVTITRIYTRLARATWLETAVRHCDPIYVILARCQAAPACEINLAQRQKPAFLCVRGDTISAHTAYNNVPLVSREFGESLAWILFG